MVGIVTDNPYETCFVCAKRIGNDEPAYRVERCLCTTEKTCWVTRPGTSRPIALCEGGTVCSGCVAAIESAPLHPMPTDDEESYYDDDECPECGEYYEYCCC